MCTTHKREEEKGKTEALLTRIWIGEEITPTDFMWKMKLKH
jgi:hypothetical protein